MENLRDEQYPHPYGNWFNDHMGVWFFLHLVSFSIIAQTGAEGLEPAAISWFWSPLLAWFLKPSWADFPCTSFGRLLHRHPVLVYWISWTIGAIVVPCLIWKHLKVFDQKVAHPLREGVGNLLGLGGQTGLLIALCSVVGLAVLVCELRAKEPQKKNT